MTKALNIGRFTDPTFTPSTNAVAGLPLPQNGKQSQHNTAAHRAHPVKGGQITKQEVVTTMSERSELEKQLKETFSDMVDRAPSFYTLIQLRDLLERIDRVCIRGEK